MEEILARIVGHLQFDGWVANKKNARVFNYSNCNIVLINEFINDVKLVFNLRPFVYTEGKFCRAFFYSAKIVRELNQLALYHSHIWHVPDFVANGTEKTKILYLQSFFDDEGYASRTHKKCNYLVVRGVSVNLEGLKGIQELLHSIGIESNLKEYSNGKTAFSLNNKCLISITNFNNIQKFHEKIKLSSKEKQSQIDNFIKYHGKNVMQPNFKIQKVLELKSNGYGARRISRMLNIPKSTVAHWLRGDRRCSK